MPRLYYPEQLITGKQIVIAEQKQIHYLCHVLRLKVNNDVSVFDGQAHEYRCQIQQIAKNKVALLIKEKIKTKSQRKIDLTVACALPKQKNRFDDLVDKLSQLGIDKIIPLITKRVIVRWDSNQKQRHHQRWLKIAQAACAQSGRNTLPVIESVTEINQIFTPLEKAIDKTSSRDNSLTGLTPDESYDLKLIPTLIGNRQNLRDIVTRHSPRTILVVIGPEGDFTKQELNQAKQAGFIPVFLGELVLRVDTAAIAVASFFRLWGLKN